MSHSLAHLLSCLRQRLDVDAVARALELGGSPKSVRQWIIAEAQQPAFLALLLARAPDDRRREIEQRWTAWQVTDAVRGRQCLKELRAIVRRALASQTETKGSASL